MAETSKEDEAPPEVEAARRTLSRRRRENRIPGETQIYVFPSGFSDAAWWHAHQVENILRVVDRLKRRYNVDESRIYLTGISDGGTGTYYMAMKDPTVWSAFLPLNGSIKVLGNPAVRADGELYANNLANRPFYIVNGGRDPLYPVEHVATHVEAFKRWACRWCFDRRPTPGTIRAGGRTSAASSSSSSSRSRVWPIRRSVSWETERIDRFNRADWLLIDRLGSGRAAMRVSRTVDIFEHQKSVGSRRHRTHAATRSTRRVGACRQFTLLLSPDAIDFTQPVTVTVNGKQVFQGRHEKDLAVLLKWAARDADRTRSMRRS